MPAELSPLDSDRNERACRLIMHGIALFPQSASSYPIIAQDVLKGYTNPGEYSVDIQDIAAVEPLAFDGLSGVVAAIHERFKVPARPEPSEIAPHIVFMSAMTVSHLGKQIRGALYRLDRSIPYEIKHMEVDWNRAQANVQQGVLVHKYLSDHAILEDVSRSVDLLAAPLRKDSRGYRRKLLRLRLSDFTDETAPDS